MATDPGWTEGAGPCAATSITWTSHDAGSTVTHDDRGLARAIDQLLS